VWRSHIIYLGIVTYATAMRRRKPTIVIAPDSFKGTLSAVDIAAAMAAGVESALGPDVHVVQCPLADGGEGTLQTLLSCHDAVLHTVDVHDAIGRPRTARYGTIGDASVAIIEAAEANGLPHLADVSPAPMRADTYGVGEIALSALVDGVEEILLCIGGGASTDGGTGLLRALGVRFLDEGGNDVRPGGAGLRQIASVDASAMDARARTARWRVACDVDNPLTGECGAATVFGPQKGASRTDIEELDAGLAHLACILADETGTDVAAIPGAGAAGGLPACLVALLNAQLLAGIDVVADVIGLTAALAEADLILTGEGSFDSQSLRGKVIHGVVRRAPAHCPVVVVAGTVKLSAAETQAAGLAGAFSIAHGPADLEQMCGNTEVLVRDTAAHVAGLAAHSWEWARQRADPRPRLSLASPH
jgi:glycerate kinase